MYSFTYVLLAFAFGLQEEELFYSEFAFLPFLTDLSIALAMNNHAYLFLFSFTKPTSS